MSDVVEPCRSKQESGDNAAPTISIVIPVRNEKKSLPALLNALLEQECPGQTYEILVVDGRSYDGTTALIERYARDSEVSISLVDNPGIRSSAGRNAGVRKARGKYIVFIDGHCRLPTRTLLRDTLRLFSQTGARCLCRPQPLLAPSTQTGKMIAVVRASRLGHGRDSLVFDMKCSGFADPASSGASYCKTVFDTVGLYDERFDACEDVDFNIRVREAGIGAYTDPSLAVFYEPRSSLRALLVQMLRYGRGRMKLAVKHPQGVSVTQFVPLFLLLATLFTFGSVTLAWSLGAPLWMLAGLGFPLLLYLMLVIVDSVALAATGGWRYLMFAPAAYFTIHYGLGAGMIAEMFAWTSSSIRVLARAVSARGIPAGR